MQGLLNGTAQIILASTVGVASVLKALAVFLPVWRDRSPRNQAKTPGDEAGAPVGESKVAATAHGSARV